jgi:hypothetical protein
MKPKAEEFYEYLAEPVKYCAKFYGFMYLSDIKDISEVGFDLLQITDELKQAFHHYGKFSIMKEMTNAPRRCGFDADITKKYVHGTIFRGLETVTNEQDEPFILANGMYRNVPRRIPETDMIEIENEQFNNDIDQALRALLENVSTGPKGMYTTNYIDKAESLREEKKSLLQNKINTYVSAVPELKSNNFFYMSERIFEDMMWSRNYGGEGWAKITKALQLIHTTTDKTFVDSMWALEHNTGGWLDKVPRDVDKEYYSNAAQQIQDEQSPDIVEPPILPTVRQGEDIIQRTFMDLLDAKREGEFYKVWPLITNADPKLAKYEDIFKNAGR